MRKCSVCKQVKSLNDFHKNKTKKLGFSYLCKDCRSKVSKEWGKTHKRKRPYRYQKQDPQKSREYHLKKKFGLTFADFDILELKQKGLCAICGLPKHQRHRKKLCIDHNHNTGQVRGLLCAECNTAIGYFKVDNLGVLNLQMAIKYLGDSKND